MGHRARHVQANPVRQIPTGKRPRQSPKDEGNRSGLRLGEIIGLRMSDLGFLNEQVIRVRFSSDGPLKEDKRREGKAKWAPAPDDLETVLGDWITARKVAEAQPEDYLFPYPSTREALAQRLEDA